VAFRWACRRERGAKGTGAEGKQTLYQYIGLIPPIQERIEKNKPVTEKYRWKRSKKDGKNDQY